MSLYRGYVLGHNFKSQQRTANIEQRMVSREWRAVSKLISIYRGKILGHKIKNQK